MKSPFSRCAVFLAATLFAYAGFADNARGQALPSGGSGNAQSFTATEPQGPEVSIPGPLRSFLRMAGISQKATPDEILPLLAHNVATLGYPEWREKPGRPTEFLMLLMRYIDQARELQVLAGPQGVLRVSSCEQARPLLAILGYELREPCGPDTAVEAFYAERAFLTVDSGFPLADLENALRSGKTFEYPYPSTRVPVLFGTADWIASGPNGLDKKRKDVIDVLLSDPALARVYWSLSRMDVDTGDALRRSPGLPKLVPFAATLDFYGSQICERSGRIVVPGGAAAEPGWKELVGAGPESPADFVTRLLAKDNGWLAAYFDALSRVSESQQTYFTDPERLRRFYLAYRGESISPGPAKHSFRPDSGLLILLTRFQLDSNGQPHVPGDLAVWKEIVERGRRSDSKVAQDWAKRALRMDTPEELAEAMVGLSRDNSKEGPLAMYLLFNEMDRDRRPERRLSAQAVRSLADNFSRFSDQYLPFSEFHELDNASIAAFLGAATSVDRIVDRTVRADALGIFQANIGLWQILARQGEIPPGSINTSWQGVVNPFLKVASAEQLFDAGRESFRAMSKAAVGDADISEDRFVTMLAGPNQASTEGEQMRQELASRIHAVLDDQRLVSLDTLFNLADGLNQMADGQPASPALLPMAAELREFEMPRPLFTTRERTEWAAGLYNVRHTTTEMKTDLAKLIEMPAPAAELEQARGQLAPFLRDTLVGLNYAYYEPPGAQMLHNDPLFIRSHDFSGQLSTSSDESWKTPILFGRGGTASGGAHLAGSLADLPYVLAEVEQDFIVPDNIQGLIWEDFVPEMLISGTLPRWWGISQAELHAVTLYQRTGEELLANAVASSSTRQRVMAILSDRMLPQRSGAVEQELRAGRLQDVLAQVAPSETFYLAGEFRRQYPDANDAWGPAGKELEALSQSNPKDVSWERVAEDFGIPHPALSQSYTRELLNVKPFPTFMGYSSRLLAESWESDNLYWARLADEMGYSAVTLNRLVPQLTHRMIENLLASHPEDWEAVLRAMRETGEEFRGGKLAALSWSGASPPKL